MVPIRVLVADDHDLVRYGITLMLKEVANIEVAGEVCSGEEALEFCRNHPVDVVLMDIRMPGMGGLEATRRMHASRPEVKIVALSAMDDLVHAKKILEAGAWGYLTKGGDPAEMTRCLESVARGRRFICADVAQEMAVGSVDPVSDNPFDKLSPQEFQVANMVIDCYKTADIASSMGIEGKTVNSYRYRIFEKLGVKSDVALARLAIQHGLVDVAQPVEPSLASADS
ncbi:response regulator [Parendozoicomonas haliclonae]|uniref:Response regulator UvrY n=1 Tax=Parendozoicomonas haliclonae TaxID=1960125 RepID=A0A1X7AM89_9GAMM|nr:response regulator [Parendozoicomonas haliclonae]SMA49060.1 Response regulator UvrY [Parendozoicomonas haliclonae]